MASLPCEYIGLVKINVIEAVHVYFAGSKQWNHEDHKEWFYPRLVYLDVANNKITEISTHVFVGRRLHNVDLAQNKLEHLRADW